MGGSKQDFKPAQERDKLGVEREAISTAQEVTIVPVLSGMQAIALRWIAPIYNLRAVEAPAEKPSKK